MHGDEEGETEHTSAHDLEAERHLKLREYLWIGVPLANLHIYFFKNTCDISLSSSVKL